MNIFVLSTGRCGSTTFAAACKHIINYSTEHESRSHLIGEEHFSYPNNHIEVDNRLSWFLGSIDRLFGNGAFYVHLKRNKTEVAESYAKRWGSLSSIITAYERSVIPRSYYKKSDRFKVAMDLCDTIENNIVLFLKDKNNKMIFELENSEKDFHEFWNRIGAKGDIDSALKEWKKIYNASKVGNKKKDVKIRKLYRNMRRTIVHLKSIWL